MQKNTVPRSKWIQAENNLAYHANLGCILMNKTTLLDVIDKNNLQCTGCGACYNICPRDAIQMVPDPLGFLQPEIDTSRCISCCMYYDEF